MMIPTRTNMKQVNYGKEKSENDKSEKGSVLERKSETIQFQEGQT